jgi:hypothetical protein
MARGSSVRILCECGRMFAYLEKSFSFSWGQQVVVDF